MYIKNEYLKEFIKEQYNLKSNSYFEALFKQFIIVNKKKDFSLADFKSWILKNKFPEGAYLPFKKIKGSINSHEGYIYIEEIDKCLDSTLNKQINRLANKKREQDLHKESPFLSTTTNPSLFHQQPTAIHKNDSKEVEVVDLTKMHQL